MSASGSSVSKLDPTPASAIPVTPLLLLAIEPQVANDNRLTMVLNIGQQDGPKPKCYFTHTALPSYIDNAHPPTKKEPFRTTLEQQYSHTICMKCEDLTLLLPASEAQQALHDKLATNDGVLRYARVYMKLIEIISGDFFNSYIKAGNIVMLSEGRVGTDNVFSLSDGILRMEVDKPTFERLGLEGKAVGSEGRKHVKARFVIELNLRLPSMLPGKKAFDRLIWACKNVLDSSLTWLFYDLRSPTDGQGPISAHAPTVKVVEPTAEPLSSVLCPTFPESIEEENRDEVAELLEWIQMTMARSPRVLQSDTVDPYICRYRPPEDSSPANLVLYQWHGFIPPAFGTKLLLAALKATGSSWFALGGEAFGGTKGYTVLRNGGNVMTWKYTD